MLLWKRHSPERVHHWLCIEESLSVRQLFAYIPERGPYFQVQRTPSLTEKVKLSLQKQLPSTCPTVSHTAASILSYPNPCPIFADKWDKILKRKLSAQGFFSMADQISPEGVHKNVMLAGQVHWNLQDLKIHRRFTDLPLMLFRS